MSIKYILNQAGGVIATTTRNNHPMSDTMSSVEDPPIAPGTDLSSSMLYKDGEIRNPTEQDLIDYQLAIDDQKKAQARKGARAYLEITNDTGISASALIEVLHRQLRKVEVDAPIESFEVMMKRYEEKVNNWEGTTEKIRFC